jgi:hypothetical protein
MSLDPERYHSRVKPPDYFKWKTLTKYLQN